jgi:hypothetical protein
MIRLFRKIRHRLLSEDNYSIYILYASGEIILVVIGILIALSIDNWNEGRKIMESEQSYLANLREEFIYNKKELERAISINNSNRKGSIELSKFMGPDTPGLTEDEFAFLFSETFDSEVQYRPSTGVLSEIISSGKLAIIENTALKAHLASWEGVILKIRFQEIEHSNTRLQAYDILKSEGNHRSILHYTYAEEFEIGQTNFTEGNTHLLRSEKFENQLSSFYITSKWLDDPYYLDLFKNIEGILQLINEELKK